MVAHEQALCFLCQDAFHPENAFVCTTVLLYTAVVHLCFPIFAVMAFTYTCYLSTMVKKLVLPLEPSTIVPMKFVR